MGIWQFPNVENLLGRIEVTKSTFQGRWALPQQLHEEFKRYELTGGLRIHMAAKEYEARIYDADHLVLDFSISILPGLLADLFLDENEYLFSHYKKRERKRLPEEQKVYLDLYKKPYYLKGVLEPRYKYDIEIYRQPPEYNYHVSSFLGEFSEDEIETIINPDFSDEDFQKWLEKTDGKAGINLKEGLKKIRLYQKNIIRDLKLRYNWCCQICGKSTINEYRVGLAEAHHIEYFSKSCNNSPNNIIILCPNHHRLVHKLDFIYEKDTKRFVCNKHILEVSANYHI